VTRLLFVVAHPDDETFGTGSLIAQASAAGAEVVVCCATRGEAGEAPEGFTGDLGALRESELRAAGALLGVRRFVLLGFGDSGMVGDPPAGALVAAPFDDVVAAVRAVVDDVAPDVVVALDPEHGDGHRDHAAIGRATVAACRDREGIRLYAWAIPRSLLARWFAEIERLRPETEHLDLDRAGLGRPDELITTVVDTSELMELRERAIRLHASQTSPFEGMPDDLRAAFLGADHLARLTPAWEGGTQETALF
jgi:LmbE family N-acetylglucosaminyl deacetylase